MAVVVSFIFMNPFLIYRYTKALVGLVVFFFGLEFFLGFEIYTRLSREWQYRSYYGSDWMGRYQEEQRVTVGKTNQDIAVALGGMIGIPGIAFLIYRQVAPNRGGSSRSRRSRRRSSSSFR